MALDSPALTLSDIMHIMSPGPATPHPVEDSPNPQPPPSASSTPEPLDSAQLHMMRQRVMELSGQAPSKLGMPSREKELLDMVLRLTSAALPDHAQLHAQAETIAELCQQRDSLLRESEEERARWDAERHGFDRMAEALIARRSRGGESTYREEELERQISTLDADNKALRQKITDYHQRVQSVEGELAQLRPVLLMQPYALTHTFHHSHAHLPAGARSDSIRHSKRRKHAATAGDDEQEASDEEVEDTTASTVHTPKAKPRVDYYRRRDADLHVDALKHKKRGHKKGSSTLADARAEHVLLAARRVGRERAAILAGLPSAIDREKAKEKRKEEEESKVTPKTPKRIPIGGASGSSTGIIYLNSPVPATGAAVSGSASSSFSVKTPQTGGKKSTASQGQGHNRVTRNNPRTPLDSLLTAARSISMIEEEDDEEEEEEEEEEYAPGPSTKARRRGRAANLTGSPLPAKRRRTAATSGSTRADPAGDGDAGRQEDSGRMRSALDVLADQAAVFSSKEGGGGGKGKGKGKATAKQPEVDAEREHSPTPVPASTARSPTPDWMREGLAEVEAALVASIRRPLFTLPPEYMAALGLEAHVPRPPIYASAPLRQSRSRSRSRPPTDVPMQTDEPPHGSSMTSAPASAVDHSHAPGEVGGPQSTQLQPTGEPGGQERSTAGGT